MFRKALTVTRFGAGAYVAGRYVPGTPLAPITIQGSVQPTKPEDLQLLPEGRRVDATYRIYTDAELIIPRESTDDKADQVTIKGEQFEVIALADWQNGVLPHRRYIVGRMDA